MSLPRIPLTKLLMSREHYWLRALGLIVLVGLLGVTGYMSLARMSFIHSLYATVITLSTLGYQDLALQEAQVWAGKNSPVLEHIMIFEVVLIVFGIAAVYYSFSVVARTLFEKELRDIVGLGSGKRRLVRMKDHFIICGFGRMGEAIADGMVSEKVPLVVIESDAERRDAILARGVTCLVGDATRDEVLAEAGVARAHGLIAVMGSDPDNLFVTLSARQLNPKLTIVARAFSPDAEKKLLRAGANRAILPYKLGAAQLTQAALRPNVLDFIEVATRTSNLDVAIEEVRVEAGSALAGRKLQEARVLRDLGLIVIGIRRAGDEKALFNPSAETAIRPEDTLIVLGKPDSLRKVQAHVVAEA